MTERAASLAPAIIIRDANEIPDPLGVVVLLPRTIVVAAARDAGELAARIRLGLGILGARVP